jgi:hypothetical protein
MNPRYMAGIFILLLALFLNPQCQFAQGISGAVQQAASQVETVGAQKMLVALFNFSDVPNKPFTLDSVRAKILSDAKSTNNFLRENSYGKTWLDVDFVDWKTLPANSNEICPGGT